jgi:hypothetical protein
MLYNAYCVVHNPKFIILLLIFSFNLFDSLNNNYHKSYFFEFYFKSVYTFY